MKAYKTVLKVLAVLAAVGAAVYVGMTYHEKIVAWFKKVLRINAAEECCCDGECCCDEECCEEACCCEEAAEEIAEEVAEEAVEAEEKDFEG